MTCVAFQGHASKLIPIMQSYAEGPQRFFMVDRAEIPLHDEYGSVAYWKVSMQPFSHFVKGNNSVLILETNRFDVVCGLHQGSTN